MDAVVPCGRCTACCKQDLVPLLPHETEYASEFYQGRRVVKRKPDGSCSYLEENGCSIHDHLPQACRRFDCRVLYLTTAKRQRAIRIMQNPTMRAVYSAGKARVETLR